MYRNKKKIGLKNIVLDIDETLIHSFVETEEEYDKCYKMNPGIFSRLYEHNDFHKVDIDSYVKRDKNKIWFLKRPFLDDFLNYIEENFNRVIIYSAGQKDYVDEIVDVLFRDRQYPDAVLSFDNLGNHFEGKYHHYTKPLGKIFRKFPSEANITNTLLIDNIEKNFLYTNKFNGITIPHFNPTIFDVVNETHALEDECLLDLMHWFDHEDFARLEDVRYIDKEKIFPRNLLREYQPPEKTEPKSKCQD